MRDGHDTKTLSLDVGDTPKKRGRPALGTRPMTAAERKAKSRRDLTHKATVTELSDIQSLTESQLEWLIFGQKIMGLRAKEAWIELGRRRGYGASPVDAVTVTKNAKPAMKKEAVTKSGTPASKAKKATVTKTSVASVDKEAVTKNESEHRIPMAAMVREAKTRRFSER
ncbi:hypothetical protein N8I74_12225 [Chitiniphilus purpureus]|uniref:Uncharacterized protein n=1 Tax=Chitiniphilus purpureus TaxID=2981137 RepID=A0ABY6DIA7_9NEIS|nr:hypothetical protein [Chitiniphilus sp. CD1]UXY14085.1 hypothetical protein N8I74_12225 [Chitiniphilus sp. CD1]